jgi:CheY-like chemotaxis protein
MNAVRPTVLLIEDDANDVALFQHACKAASVSFSLLPIDDSEKALAYLGGDGEFSDRAAHPFPALVLLDWKMPRMAGCELLKTLRTTPAFRHVPVIAFTASQNIDDINNAYQIGANSYLLKPDKLEELVEMARVIDKYWLGWNKRPES